MPADPNINYHNLERAEEHFKEQYPDAEVRAFPNGMDDIVVEIWEGKTGEGRTCKIDTFNASPYQRRPMSRRRI